MENAVNLQELKNKAPYIHMLLEENIDGTTNPIVTSFSDNFNFDAFGRLRVSQVTSLLELTHIYSLNIYKVDQKTNASATSSLNLVNSCVNLSVTSSGDYVIRQSKFRPPYQPGKGQLVELTFSKFHLENNIIKRVGYFSSSETGSFNTNFDGFFLESNGDTNKITFQVWHSGSLFYSASSNEWANADLVSSLDWSKTQLALMDFQWLGVGRVRMGMLYDGVLTPHASSCGTNNNDTVYMTSPSQPIRYELRSTGGTGSLDQICSQVSMEGSVNSLFEPIVITSANSSSLATAGVKYPFIGLKMSGSYSNTSPSLRNIQVVCTSNDNYVLTVEMNPTFSTPINFTSSQDNSYGYALPNGSPTVSGSGKIMYSSVGTAGAVYDLSNIHNHSVKYGKNIDGTVDQLWVCITPLSNAATFIGSANYEIMG